MPTGAVTGYIDVAQIVLYAFWLFFAALVFYLRREDKREGYPLESERSPYITVQGFPARPKPKVFLRTHGGTYTAPGGNPERAELNATPAAVWPGAPLHPTGDPLLAGVGPGAWVQREDEPDLTAEGKERIVPMRADDEFFVEPRDPDPRGMAVIGADGRVAGTVRELWVDRSEPAIRFFEVELVGGGGPILVPYGFARINTWRRQVRVQSLLAHQFSDVPGIANADTITKREEDRITAFFAGGKLYAEPRRLFPAL